ncbi:UPF0769 protein C21orf59 homolog [Eumeta japonica]|uniref:UPF0769 protein C21orf59 homolog n=1 Tax=Eumeta variegata TaxID=151549 RepID=A0A4C1VPC9_EUMVA|nr:UPF0769 protein C21orf59 homolog [Eumeta japonica]
MVILHVKRGDQSQFLYETDINNTVDDVVKDIVAIYNGRLKIERICYEMEELGKHGTSLPPEMQGLTDEQLLDLKLEDPWAKRCAPQGYHVSKDTMGRRCGLAPPQNLEEVLKKAAETAKEYVSKKHVGSHHSSLKHILSNFIYMGLIRLDLLLTSTVTNALQYLCSLRHMERVAQVKSSLVDLRKCLTQKDVTRALDELRGATKIVFPAGLPPHDPVRQELENVEDLTGTQASLEVIDPSRACLWACGKMFLSNNKLSDHLGRNNKSKAVVKLCSSKEGAPGREPIMTEDERKQLMLHAYRKQEEWKKLEEDDDDHYLDSSWADGNNLKRQFHGLTNISWKPK